MQTLADIYQPDVSVKDAGGNVLSGIITNPLEFDNEVLRQEVSRLEKKNNDLLVQNRLLLQLCDALGDTNRYLASEALGHYASDNEAFLHYVENGGKKAFDQNHPRG